MGNASSLTADDIAEIQKETPFTERDIQRLERRFRKIKSEQPGDSNEIRTITKQAFLCAPESSLNPMAERIVATIETEEPESISFPEFCRLCAVFAPDPETKMKMVFRAYDADADGHIDATEMAKVLRTVCHIPLDDSELEQASAKIIARFDRNSDGRIDFEEFKMIFQPSDALGKMTVAI